MEICITCVIDLNLKDISAMVCPKVHLIGIASAEGRIGAFMGYYINPFDMSKEEFLQKHGLPLQAAPINYDFTGDKLLVCLVDNGWMTAARIVYHTKEIDVLNSPSDKRPRKWFEVSKTDLEPYYKS